MNSLHFFWYEVTVFTMICEIHCTSFGKVTCSQYALHFFWYENSMICEIHCTSFGMRLLVHSMICRFTAHHEVTQ